LQANVERAREAASECLSELRLERERKAATRPTQPSESGFEGFGSEQHSLFQLRTALHELHELSANTDAAAANNPALLLTGCAKLVVVKVPADKDVGAGQHSVERFLQGERVHPQTRARLKRAIEDLEKAGLKNEKARQSV
jgi:hypothetical protein